MTDEVLDELELGVPGIKTEIQEATESVSRFFAWQTAVSRAAQRELEAAGYSVLPHAVLNDVKEGRDLWKVRPDAPAAPLVRLNYGPGVRIVEEPMPGEPDDGAIMARLLTSSSFQVLSMQTAQTVDRAARGRGWAYPTADAPRFQDTNEYFVEYYQDGLELEALREGVATLNPRTADVWRLVTAHSLERWQDGQLEPPAVWVDVRELLEAMGYKKHHKGGYRTEHIREAAQALVDLDRFHITVPRGATIFPMDPKTGKRKSTRLEAQTRYKVMTRSATDEFKDLFGERYPLRWLLKPGEWIKGYGKQYAPLFRALIALTAENTGNLWAKAIGTELAYQYRQDRDRSQRKVLRVEKLLERAVLLSQVKEWDKNRNASRGRKYFDEALDKLQELGVCEGWEYIPEDFDRMEAAPRGQSFAAWLEARVAVTAPHAIVAALPVLPAARAASGKGERKPRTKKVQPN